MQNKVYMIGLDGMMYPLYHRFAQEGILPNLKKLADNGFTTEVYSSLPAYTPTNWATLMTGAHTGTHSILRWYVDLPEPKRTTESINSFVGTAIKAETVFEAAAHTGLKSVAFHYPASAPRRTDKLYTVDGFANPTYGSSPFEVSPAHTYTNIPEVSRGYQVNLTTASGWKHHPESKSPPLEFQLVVITKQEGENRTFNALVLDTEGKGYNKIVICAAKDTNTRIAVSQEGSWSEWCRENFSLKGRNVTGTFRFKVIELASDASRLRLYRSQIVMMDEICEPKDLGKELIGKFGPYQEHDSLASTVWGATDFATSLEEMDYQAQWVARAGTYMMNVKNCSLFYCHIHIFDHINHRHLSGIDPASPGYNESSAPEHWEIYRKAYMTADRMIGTIMEEVDLNTTNIIVASDHAAIPDKRAINMRKFLVERGFLSVKDPDAGLNNDVVENENIDWEHTKAFMKPGRGYDIFINADEGTKEYTDIQNELIRTLRTWVDSVTGDCPVAIALRKKDAPLLGFWSNQCGDVVFINEDGYVHGYMGEWHHILEEKSLGEPFWYGAHHGTQLPTSRTSIASNMAFLLASGPGIKKGYDRPVDELGYIHMTSIVPLICHLLDIETPAQCQGYLPRDILESGPEALTRRFDYPEWEPGTRPGGWGNRIQIQKDMFDFVSSEDK